jgi:hypothetical protein
VLLEPIACVCERERERGACIILWCHVKLFFEEDENNHAIVVNWEPNCMLFLPPHLLNASIHLLKWSCKGLQLHHHYIIFNTFTSLSPPLPAFNGKTTLLWQIKRQEGPLDCRGGRKNTCTCIQPWDWKLDLGSQESRFWWFFLFHMPLMLFYFIYIYIIVCKVYLIARSMNMGWVKLDVCMRLCTGLNRCGKSCRLRWTNYLKPDLKHDSFTPQEEELIINLHKAIGSRWVSQCDFFFKKKKIAVVVKFLS